MNKRQTSKCLLCIGFFVAASSTCAHAQRISVEQVMGPKVAYGTTLGDPISVGSTMQLHFFVVNDDSSPLTLSKVGLEPVSGSTTFNISSVGSVKTTRVGVTVLGFRLNYVCYDAFGELYTQTNDAYLTDLKYNGTFDLTRNFYKWTYDRFNLSKLLYVATFVSDIRYRTDATAQETIWSANRAEIMAAASRAVAKTAKHENSVSRAIP